MSPTSLLCACSVSELLAGLSSGAVSAEEILNSCLGRIRLREAEVKAWAYLDSDNGFAAKKALSRNKKNEKLRGIPFAAKDVFEVASTPKSYGSQLYAAEISKRSSSVVDTLVAAGAVFLGKTVTAEFALYKPGATCNPHNIEHTPGGSSSGSAAAVADCQAPIALGTQTAGSIVRPASYCGVIGYKPTLGRYSTTGVRGERRRAVVGCGAAARPRRMLFDFDFVIFLGGRIFRPISPQKGGHERRRAQPRRGWPRRWRRSPHASRLQGREGSREGTPSWDPDPASPRRSRARASCCDPCARRCLLL